MHLNCLFNCDDVQSLQEGGKSQCMDMVLSYIFAISDKRTECTEGGEQMKETSF